MGIFRRHRDDEKQHLHYQMREKLISIGDDYWIEDDDGNKAYKVNGKALRVRDTWVLEDASGRRGRDDPRAQAVSVRDAITIELADGHQATVKKALVGIRDRFHVDVDGGPDLKVARQHRRPRVRDRARRRHDRRGVEEVVPRPRHLRGRGRRPATTPVLVLAITVAVDALAHDLS